MAKFQRSDSSPNKSGLRVNVPQVRNHLGFRVGHRSLLMSLQEISLKKTKNDKPEGVSRREGEA